MSIDTEKTITVRGASPRWISTEEVWPGVAISILHHDPNSGLLVALFKFEPGTRLPLHHHPSDGHGFILEGEYVENGEAFGPWTYVMAPAGVPHGANTHAGPDGYIALGLYPHGSGIFERFIERRTDEGREP
jgi:quercetin dioxygenase-like cupin family protein